MDNFLGFDVGQAVPVGYYDRDAAQWVPAPNGVVVRLLDTDNDGVSDAMDADGDNLPDDLDGDGSTTDEARGLEDPAAHPPDATFWRVETDHFTPFDFNWPIFSPDGAVDPNPPAPPTVDEQCDDCNSHVSSYVEERSRIFHEDIPIPGVGAHLHYASNRTDGYRTIVTVPASGETVPDVLKRIVIRLEAAGCFVDIQSEPEPDVAAEITWDNLDHLAGKPCAPLTARVSVGFVYDGVYGNAGDVDPAFAQADREGPGTPARQEVTRWQRTTFPLRVNKSQLAEGWTLSSHHSIHPMNSNILYKGDGSTVHKTESVIETFAGNGEQGGVADNIPALSARFNNPAHTALDTRGNLYIADTRNHAIRKVDKNGVITRIAGNGNPVMGG